MKKITTNDPETRSADVVNKNLERLKVLFPEAFTEGKVDFEVLKQLLDGAVDEREEKYDLNWHGKRQARQLALTPSTGTLRPCSEESVDWDTTQNLVVEGDNLEVLKLLQKSYANRVKMIYIDPPYNTGKDFIYPDDYRDNIKNYLELTGQIDGEHRKLSSNTEASGRFHTAWLNMMMPRLKLARQLLSSHGAIFVSIDDNEASNLRLLMDEVFGPENYLVTHYVQVRYASKTLAEKNDYQKLIEQVLVYQKNYHPPNKETAEYSLDKFCWKIVEKEPSGQVLLGGRHVEIFPEGSYEIIKTPPSLSGLKETWATGSILAANASGKYFGTHLAPRKEIDGLKVLYKVHGIGEDGLGFRYFTGPRKSSATKGKFYSGVPLARVEQLTAGDSVKTRPIANFYDFAANFGNCRHEGNTDFRGGKKPLAFLSKLINQAVKGDEEAIILDFFGGSASTAHAVLHLNSQDNGNRRFILVQLPEPLDEESKTAHKELKTVFNIGKERIQKVIQELATDQEAASLLRESEEKGPLDLGFRVFKLDSTNVQEWEPDCDDLEGSLLNNVDHIKSDRSEDDILYELLLKLGLDLCVPIETRDIAGKSVHSIGTGALITCLAERIDREDVEPLALGIADWHDEIAPAGDSTVVFRDSAFADDVAKTNLTAILDQRGLGHVRSL